MTKTFVAIHDPVHALIRRVTRETPLVLHCLADGTSRIEYQVAVEKIPEAYYALVVFHTFGGLRVESFHRPRWRAPLTHKSSLLQRANYFDVVRLDRRCARDLRLKIRRDGPGMLAAELLAFGTGTLRACNDNPFEETSRYLWSRHGRLRPRQQTVYARIRALHLNSLPLLQPAGKETFDSTNVIYGDVLGELEQLWERRADTAFLEGVAHYLKPLRTAGEVAAFFSPPLNVKGVVKLHLRAQALWRTPPANARLLLRRIEYLLEHIQVDSSPCTFFRRYDSEFQPNHPGAPASGWTSDCSGYDGWLSKS